MDRKPEAGVEIQNAACGRSKVMIQLKLVKNVGEANPQADDAGLLHGTVVMKQLLDPWIGQSTRIVCADFYFASVGAALELKRLGFRFIGVIKTATKEFPICYLQGLQFQRRGDLKATVFYNTNGRPELFAFVWVDRDRRYFVCNGGSLEAVEPISRTRLRKVDQSPNAEAERVRLEIPHSKATQVYYQTCGSVDSHNRKLQDDLDIEKKTVRTHFW
jgi:hypothetical protein